MENGNTLNLTFSSSLTDMRSANTSFDFATLRIAYPGKNRKNSSISKEVFEKCAGSIYNVPIVTHYTRDTDTLGGHDMEVYRDANNAIRVVNVTEPVGVVPESARQWWEVAEDEYGEEHEYLYTDVLLWKRQEAYKKIKRDGITAHSMEITINDCAMVDGCLEIRDFEYTAFCLIGVEPAYTGSQLSFSLDNAKEFKERMSEMMNDLKETFSSTDSCVKNELKGGKTVLSEKMELAAKYGIDVDSLEFSLDDFSIEELTAKFEAMKNEPEEVTPTTTEQFSLSSQMIDEIARMLCEEKISMEWGEVPKYSYIDCDFEACEVYAYDRTDWLMYGFTYAVDGDAVKIDFDSKKRKKFAIVDFDGQEQPALAVFSEMENTINEMFASAKDWEQKYSAVSEELATSKGSCEELTGKYSALESEVTELRQFKASVENAAAEQEREAVFSAFSDLEGIEAFDALKENCDGMDAEALKKECFAIRGEFGMTGKFSFNNPMPVRIKVPNRDEQDDTNDKPYGGIVEYYAERRKHY